jgi:hypothetical protein
VTEHIQSYWQLNNGTFPATFKAPAHGPTWRCRYRRGRAGSKRYTAARCSSASKLVTVNFGS